MDKIHAFGPVEPVEAEDIVDHIFSHYPDRLAFIFRAVMIGDKTDADAMQSLHYLFETADEKIHCRCDDSAGKCLYCSEAEDCFDARRAALEAV